MSIALGITLGVLFAIGIWRLFTFGAVAYDGADMCSGGDAPRCPRCGSYVWVYKGDRQVCGDCGR
jgi:hypothetical protein